MRPWRVVFTRQARKDARRLAGAGLKPKAEYLLAVMAKDPFQSPPPFEKLFRAVPPIAWSWLRCIWTTSNPSPRTNRPKVNKSLIVPGMDTCRSKLNCNVFFSPYSPTFVVTLRSASNASRQWATRTS